MPAFEEPIVGFSCGDDPLFAFYKDHIAAEFYLTPHEWLAKEYGKEFDPAGIRVISWGLPQTAETLEGCRKLTGCPSLEWQLVRVHGESCNRGLAKAVEAHLRDMGLEAVAPMCSERFVADMDQMRSNWSERHTAYISGLGTFGLCGGLITEKGKAMRFGSVIVNHPFEPTPRPYTSYNQYCLADRGCTACMKRCPVSSITLEGRDKEKCKRYHKTAIPQLCREQYGYEGFSVCGLCQSGVPCERGIPEPFETLAAAPPSFSACSETPLP